MKKVILFILALSFIATAHSQDIIVKKDGTSIKAKVEEIGVDLIKYYKFENLTGPIYSIEKSDVVIINFENGSFELINSELNEDNLSPKEKLQSSISYYFKEYCSSNSGTNAYEASFIGDYIYIRELDKFKTGYGIDVGVFNFSEVSKFLDVIYRKKDRGFLNIFVLKQTNKKKDKWKEINLRFRVKSHLKADELMVLLKQYNKLLLEEKNKNKG